VKQWAYDYEVVSLRVATYNICINTFEDERKWSNRKILISDMIKTGNWDIIGIQEASTNLMNDLCELSDGYQWLGRETYFGNDVVFMYKSTRFEVLESGDFWYSETPDELSIGWGAAYPAKCSWVKFRDKNRDKVFYFFNSHYAASTSTINSTAARTQSAILMKTKIKEIAGDNSKVFATGDYNSTPTTDAIKNILAGDFLKDSRILSESLPTGPDNTCNDWQTPNNAKYDWIFLPAGIRVLSYKVQNDRPNGQYPSDHDPVVIDVKF
jgi:endonuclease/exonuclease/phosphatase family metal-dependent hydrolase